MQILVKRTSRENDVVYRISQSGRTIIQKRIKRLVPTSRVSENTIIGMNNLFNIPGRYPVYLQSESMDRVRIRQDFERVGQSIYDGVLVVIEK